MQEWSVGDKPLRHVTKVLGKVGVLNITQAENLIWNLTQVIKSHNWCYSVKNSPVISDSEYDVLFNRLVELEQKYPSLLKSDSPTQGVSDDSNNTDKFKHLSPILSLKNSYNEEDLNNFDDTIRNMVGFSELPVIEYCVEPKFDGGTIVLVYENDDLLRGATRGDGISGDNISVTANAIESIPMKALFSKYGIHKAELRGEAIIQKDLFVVINEKRATKGKQIFANPRNAATGGLQLKTSAEVKERGLTAFIFQLSHAEDINGKCMLNKFGTHNELVDMLSDLGFKVPVYGMERQVYNNITDVNKHCQEWERKREEYPFEIDGMVIKVNLLGHQKTCGHTNHHPRWAIAYKFKAKQATTTLLDVEYQIGRTGAITPVGKLEPVQLAGVTISSVSLHNADFILKKGLLIGDKILLERAGDVIPYVVKPLTKMRDGTEKEIVFPTNCIKCDSVLVRPTGEAIWRCENTSCEGKVINSLIHFVSKDAMDIQGFGKSYIERFYKEGLLSNITDIYKLDYVAIESLSGFGKKSVDKLKIAIEQSKSKTSARLLYALGIRFIGRTVSKILMGEVKRIQDLEHLTIEQLMSLEDIGHVVGGQIIEHMRNPQILDTINQLERLGVNVWQLESEMPVVVNVDDPFNGLTFLFTGKFEKMSRVEAKKMVEDLGGKASSGVSKSLSYLVVGEKAGSKLKKAKALGVDILSESEFLDMITKQGK